jgi:hypothetical protein
MADAAIPIVPKNGTALLIVEQWREAVNRQRRGNFGQSALKIRATD